MDEFSDGYAIFHAKRPYQTVYNALMALRAQFGNKIPFKVYPYIELSNYRNRMSYAKKLDYIRAQIKAVNDAGMDGWYAWSPHNHYNSLFRVLEK